MYIYIYIHTQLVSPRRGGPGSVLPFSRRHYGHGGVLPRHEGEEKRSPITPLPVHIVSLHTCIYTHIYICIYIYIYIYIHTYIYT